MKNLNLEIKRDAKQIDIKIAGEMITMAALDLKRSLPEIIERNKLIRVDMTKVAQMDLTGLNALMMTKVKANKSGSDVIIIANDTNPIHRLLHLTKFHGQFTIIPPNYLN